MKMPSAEPDQQPARWNDHVSVYEHVFEPFSTQFAGAAINALLLSGGDHVLDVGAGAGGTVLALARRGMRVTAVDAAERMVARTLTRSVGLNVAAKVMDGQLLTFPDGSFDAALSVFGVTLFPDAVRGLAEMRRVVRPGGRVAVVTWTEPHNYELATALRAAIQVVRPDTAPGALPAQLRFREHEQFETLFAAAGFADVAIDTVSAHLMAPSAQWLAEHIAFAPGMAAQLVSLGDDRARVLQQFVHSIEASQGTGEVRFQGKAFVGMAANVT